MKILFVSDIHGCLPTLQQVLSFYDREHYDMLCILGDILNYGPRNRIPEGIDPKGIVELLNARKHNIVAVRGNCDAEVDQMLLQFPIMADYALVVDGTQRFFLTHGHVYNEQNRPTLKHDIFIYGHTHLWKLEETEPGRRGVQSRLYHLPQRRQRTHFRHLRRRRDARAQNGRNRAAGAC